MAKATLQWVSTGGATFSSYTSSTSSLPFRSTTTRSNFCSSRLVCLAIRASYSMDDKDKVYKELGLSITSLIFAAFLLTFQNGLFTLRKKIDDAILRAKMLGQVALELEEARQIEQEETLHQYDLWDDVAKSNEVLINLADTTKVVNSLKDLRYKAEEAQLITELAEMDVINYWLFKEAYTASKDVSKFLDQYEMSKLLRGPYDTEGACIIIKAEPKGILPEIWAGRLLSMYLKWAENQGFKGRVVEKSPSECGGIKSAAIELEFEYAYGYLSGEKGVHRMIKSSIDRSIILETSLAVVDIIPLFLERPIDLQVDDNDLLISSLSPDEEHPPVSQTEKHTKPAVSIQHIPSGITAQSSGERSNFANRVKALNRLKAKLLVIARDQGVSNVKNINVDVEADMLCQDTRRYIVQPYKLVQDVKTRIQLSDLDSVLDGNIQALIGANISIRQVNGKVPDISLCDIAIE